MRPRLALLLALLPLGASADEDPRVDALEQAVDALSQRVDQLSQQLAGAQGTLDRAGSIEQARLARVRALRTLLEDADATEASLTAGVNTTDDFVRYESTLRSLYADAVAHAGRLESDQEYVAATSAKLAQEALAEGDYMWARNHLAAMYTSVQGALDAATENTGRAFGQ